MKSLKCPADVVYEKEWRAAYGNRCNAIFLSTVMHDGEAVRKMYHNEGGTHQRYPIMEALWKYYQNHDKKELLDAIEAATLDKDGFPIGGHRSSIFVDIDETGKRILRDWSSVGFVSRHYEESNWADLSCYEKRATMRIADDWGSRQSVYYDHKSVAEVLKETVEKTTFLEKQISEKTGNRSLDMLVQNLLMNENEKLHVPTYYQALKLINQDLTEAFENRRTLEEDAYMPVIIMLDERSAGVFNQIDYQQQRVFHKSDLGQEMLKFSYLTTQNLSAKDDQFSIPEFSFDEKRMKDWLSDIKNTDLWQVAQRKITMALAERMAHRVRTGSLLNNRLLELGTLKNKPKESMYDGYWRDDANRAQYMNLYKLAKSGLTY